MKRPKLRESLAHLKGETAKLKSKPNNNNDDNNTNQKTKKLDKKSSIKSRNRIIWHQWSDGERTLQPYRPGANSNNDTAILIIGDGDFSFSRALLETIPGKQIISSTCETEMNVQKKYPTCLENLNALRSASATILFEFDITKAKSLKYLAGKMNTFIQNVPIITRIVFNFPHTGEGIRDRDYNIQSQRKLVLAFLTSSAQILIEQAKTRSVPPLVKGNLLTRKAVMASSTPTIKGNLQRKRHSKGCSNSSDDEEDEYDGEYVDYEDGNGNGDGDDEDDGNEDKDQDKDKDKDQDKKMKVTRTRTRLEQQSEIHLTSWCGDPYEDWNIKKLASTTGKLSLLESFSFNQNCYVGYKHCRTNGYIPNDNHNDDDGTSFAGRPARTFVFVLS